MQMISHLKKAQSRLKNGLFAIVFLMAYSVSAVAPFIATAPASAAIISTCTSDAQGANDQPGQKDLTKFCPYTDDASGEVTVGWAWDETSFSGNNSGDACALFDADGDGNANYAVCVSIKGNPATQVAGSPFVYSCADTSATNCDSATSVTSAGTACTTSSSTNPFVVTDADTYVACTIKLADVGGSTAVLKDVCSYPSSSRPSDPSDCVVTPTATSPMATIQIRKVVSPATGDNGFFNLNIGADTYATGGSGTNATVTTTPGNSIVVNETGANGTNLANYTTSVACMNGNKPVTGVTDLTNETKRSITISVADKDNVTCAFTNTRLMGTVKVVKDVVNNNGGDKNFADFTYKNGATPITLSAKAGDLYDGEATLSLPVGSAFDITETDPTSLGYALTMSGTCMGTVTTALQTCTLKNDDVAPQLIVIKHLVDQYNSGKTASNFTMNVTGTNVSSSSFAGAESPGTTVTLDAGSYSVNEGSHAGFDMTASADCAGTIQLGQVKTCTITNTAQPAKLKVQKTVVNRWGGDKKAADFAFSLNGSTTATAFTALVDDDTKGENTLDLSAGVYSVTEPLATNGYTATYANNQNSNADCSDLQLTNGVTVTCSITNTDTPASIWGEKYITNLNGSPLTVADSQVPAAGWVITLYQKDANNNWAPVLDNLNNPVTTTTDANGNYKFENLTKGIYAVVETLRDGWRQVFGSTSSAPQQIDLAMGQQAGKTLLDNGTLDSPFDFGNYQIIPVVAMAPTVKADLCGTARDFYTIPTTDHVTYMVGGVAKVAGDYSSNGAMSVVVTAVAEDGYSISGDSSWTLNFNTTPCPTVSACTELTGPELVSVDTQFADSQDTRANGHYYFTGDGLRIYTDGDTDTGPRTDGKLGTWNTDKVAWYNAITPYPLSQVGIPNMEYSADFGLTPGMQMVVDKDADGTPDGILVGETAYGTGADMRWWSNVPVAPTSPGGDGGPFAGTLNQILADYPTMQVLGVGFSLGSGVHASGILHSLTFGCHKWVFGHEPTTPLACTVSNMTYTKPWQYDGETFPVADTNADGDASGSYLFAVEGLHINTPDAGSYVYGLTDAGMTRLSDVDALSYKTYRKAVSAGYEGTQPSYVLYVDTVGAGNPDDFTYFLYEPYYNSASASSEDVWQTWDGIADGQAKWYASGPSQTLHTWDWLVNEYPDAVVMAYGFNQGTDNQETFSVVQDVVFDCATTHFTVEKPGEVLGETTTTPNVVVTKTTAKLQDTGNSLVLPILIAFLTSVLAIAVAFDKQRKQLMYKMKQGLLVPFIVPGA